MAREVFLAPSDLILFWVLIGLALGSFVSVLTARIPERSKLTGRSICPNCQRQILARDNIPLVGYILLKGRCRFCGIKISLGYLLFELITAICILIPVFAFQSWWLVLAWINFIVIGIALSVIDFKYHRLPNKLTFPLFCIGFFTILLDAIYQHQLHQLKTALIASVLLTIFYFALNMLSRGGMGMGDVKLAASIGLITGYLGLPYVLTASFAAFFIGSMVGLFMIVIRKATRKTPIPFGPFMIIGTISSIWLTPWAVQIMAF